MNRPFSQNYEEIVTVGSQLKFLSIDERYKVSLNVDSCHSCLDRISVSGRTRSLIRKIYREGSIKLQTL